MPVKYVVVNDGRLVIERWSGRIPHAELIEHEKRQLSDTSIVRGAIGLADARHAVFPETALSMIPELADTLADPENKTSISRYALLVASETWEQAKVFEKEAKKHGITIITFSLLESACDWLGIDRKMAADCLKEITF